MEKELISVIVPIYNVEDYLVKCLDSIINQTYKNLEIILIDDGSTDNCGKICDKYKKMDSRIKVVHKENGGLSSARNAGLDIATGTLIGFVDSDDYLELTMYEKLKNNMDICNSDIASCNIYFINKNKSNILINNKKDFCSTGKEKFYFFQNYAWNKIYKKWLFNNIRYPVNQICEDSAIICDLIDRATTTSYISEPLYNYVYRKNSIIHNFNIKHFDGVISIDRKIDFFNKKHYYDLLMKEKNKKMNILINNLSKMKRYHINNKNVYKKFYKELLDTNKKVEWKNATWKNKVFKVFRRPTINVLAFGLRMRDFIRR